MTLINFFKGLFEKYLFKDTSSKNVFDHYFFDLKYYLHQDASIENFAFLLNITSNKVAQIAATYYNCSFQVLLNEHRCNHVVLELNNPVNAGLSMESIVKLSGFESSEQYSDYLKGNMNQIKSGIKVLAIVF
jgi:AraC-like DNA-binding protein